MGKRSRQPVAATLDDRFKFDEDSIRVGGARLESRLRPATDLETGERYLVRLFSKTGTAIDQDLRMLVDGGLRRIRRVLSSRRAREVLVDVVEVVEDGRELGIVMLDPGVPLLGSPRKAQARRELCMTNAGRRDFWRNVSRVVEALTYCHDAGIMHGAIDEHTIFVGDERSPTYRLGGYEACVHFADEDLSPSEMALRKASSISFRHDLADLARVMRSALGLGLPDELVLTSIERRMLARMAEPPQFQLYDAHTALKELSEVVEELDRLGSSAEGELVLYPSPKVLRSDLASLASGAILADDVDAIMGFVADDFLRADTYAAVDGPRTLRVVTGLAVYSVEIADGRVGAIVRCARRRPDDALAEAFEIKTRIYLARNRGAALERVRNLGNGALSWTGLRRESSATASLEDPPSWHALILLEAFSLLRQQFRTYPIEVLVPPHRSELVWIAPRPDEDREAQRARLKMPSLAVALHQEMRHDEGRPDWTVSISDALGRPRERLPELSLETIAEIEGVRAYGFLSSEPVLPEQDLYLRPRSEGGTEGAIRRRLQNVVAARTNVELLRALDDPATVPMDEALRIVAAPGEPPDKLDPSKKEAWDSVVVGRSVNVVVGPPGVGKTFLVARLIESILVKTASARILVSSQNHETLVSIEHELKGVLTPLGKIVVRVQKTEVGTDATLLRKNSREFLEDVSRDDGAGPLVNPYREIREALRPTDEAERAVADRVLRDTDNLLLRSSDVTLATTSSPFVEETIADGEQFDWVFVEEAARANGAELIGALLLGNRRVMIGDHRQLSPFEATERKRFFEPFRADELLKDGADRLASIPDLPPEVDETLGRMKADRRLLIDVLAAATRLEEPFRTIAEREKEREDEARRPSSIAKILKEQSRMHPAICQVVSNTFYGGELVSTDRVRERKVTVASNSGFPASPFVVLDLPPLGASSVQSFEKRSGKALTNPAEATALVDALSGLRSAAGPDDKAPSLVVLATYSGQVTLLERLLMPKVDTDGRLQGFVSPRGDGRFIYTSDSFQGGEADVVFASLVRNNVLVGKPALGFLSNPQRLNVLLSRARQKLVVATSLQFLLDVVDGTDPDKAGGDLGFVRKLVGELRGLAEGPSEGGPSGVTILPRDQRGKPVS